MVGTYSYPVCVELYNNVLFLNLNWFIDISLPTVHFRARRSGLQQYGMPIYPSLNVFNLPT